MLQAASKKAKEEVVNVGNTQEVPKRRCLDTSKLERLVGWKTNVSFEEGLKRTVEWFKNQF